MTRGPATAVRATFPVKSALLLAFVGSLALHWRTEPAPQPPPQYTCIEPPAEPAAPVARPANLPGPELYTLLDACLRSTPPWPGLKVDVAQIRYWVEVEHHPAWFSPEVATWWLPLSGEGNEYTPSGAYIIVPMSGLPCGGAIVN